MRGRLGRGPLPRSHAWRLRAGVQCAGIPPPNPVDLRRNGVRAGPGRSAPGSGEPPERARQSGNRVKTLLLSIGNHLVRSATAATGREYDAHVDTPRLA